MFCPECGKSNPEGLKNCLYCNAELVETVGGSSSRATNTSGYEQTTQSFDFSETKASATAFLEKIKAKKKIVIPALIIAVVFVVGFSVVSYITSPKRVVESYLDNMINGNFDDIYDELLLPEGSFMTKEQFTQMMQEDYQYTAFSDAYGYSIEKNASDTSFGKTYTFYLKRSGTSAENLQQVVLEKQDNAFLFLFSNYKVVLDDIVCSDLEISLRAPQGCTLEIDGIELESSYDSYSYGYTTYEIDNIFTGKHNVRITGDMIENFEDEIYIYQSSNSITIDETLYLNSSEEDSLISTIAQDLQMIYDSAIVDKDSNEIDINLARDNQLYSVYGNISFSVNKSYWDNYSVQSIALSNFAKEQGRFSDSKVSIDKNGTCSISLTYDYSYSKYYSDTGETSSSFGQCASTEFVYVYSDGQWYFKDMYYYYIDF